MIEEGTISFMFYNDDTVYTDEFDNDEPITHYETSVTLTRGSNSGGTYIFVCKYVS